jgi:competence protein ComFC
MTECLICEAELTRSSSWKGLVGLDTQTTICTSCSKKFVRAEINEVDPLVDKITSLYIYNEAMRDYLHQYKFLQDIQLASVFSAELRLQLKGNATIVPIPMHPAKKIERTFSHVDELLKQANIPFSDLLEKTNSEVMGEKAREQRLAMNSLFRVKPEVVLKSGTYILVDDIYTTGTTLRHAASALRSAGAERVEALTLIRAEKTT